MGKMLRLLWIFAFSFFILMMQVKSQTIPSIKTTKKKGKNSENELDQNFDLQDKRSVSHRDVQSDALVFVEKINLRERERSLHEREEQVETCQFTVTMPRDGNCAFDGPVESEMSHMQQLVSAIQSQVSFQRRRLDSAESVIRRIRLSTARSAAASRETSFTTPVDRDSNPGPVTNRRAISEAAATLQSLSEKVQVMLTNLEIQIDEADDKRLKLEVHNSNLTSQLSDKENLIANLTRRVETLRESNTRVQASLDAAGSEKSALLAKNRLIKLDQTRLLDEKRLLADKLTAETTENERLRSDLENYRDEVRTLLTDKLRYQENLSNATRQITEMRSTIKTLSLKNSTKTRCSNGFGFPLIDENHEMALNYTHCGLLINVSEPQTVRQSKKTILHRVGVWMKDPVRAKRSTKVWSINQSGVRVRKFYQYANMSAFQSHQPEIVHSLPVPVESNGAVVYNGSLYFQRRNSRRIVRFDIAARSSPIDRSVKRAGFHGMFAYQWGGFTDLDFAVDETGLWVIYSTPRNRGNIIVSKINPKTLRIIKTIRTPIPKRKVANSFIICQVLYTVSSFRAPIASINYSFDLKTRTWKKLNIPFQNNYQFNTMVDYNPADRFIYAWDNGRQVRYKITLDQSMGEIHDPITNTS